MTAEEAHSVETALAAEFSGRAESEQVSANGRYRFAVVSERFSGLSQLRRQDLVWAVADRVLPRETTLDISLILAFAPAELSEVGVEN